MQSRCTQAGCPGLGGIPHAQEVKPADRLCSCETMDSPAPEVAGELSARRDNRGESVQGRSRWSPWSAGQYVTGVIPTRFSASVAAVTVVVRWKMRCGGRSLRVRGLVLLGNRRIAGLRGGRTCRCVRGEGGRMGSGPKSACLKRLLPQRIQVLLLPVLLECVADKGDHCSGNSDHNEYHDHACRRIRRLRRGRRTGGGRRTG